MGWPSSPLRTRRESSEYQHVVAGPAGIKLAPSSHGTPTTSSSIEQRRTVRRHRRRNSQSSSVSAGSASKKIGRRRSSAGSRTEDNQFFVATTATTTSSMGSPRSRKSFGRRSSTGSRRRRRKPKALVTPCDTGTPPEIAPVASTSPTTGCSSSESSAKRDERNTTRSPDIFRAPTSTESPILYKPQYNDSSDHHRSSPSLPQDDDDDDGEDDDGLWTLEPTPKWYQWEYWQQRFHSKGCCLPPDETPMMEPKLYIESNNVGISLNRSFSPMNGMRKSTPAPYYPPTNHHNIYPHYYSWRSNPPPPYPMRDPVPYYLYPQQAPMMYPYPQPQQPLANIPPAPLQVYIPTAGQHVRSVSAISMGSSVPPPEANDELSLSSHESVWSKDSNARKTQSRHRRRASSSPCVVVTGTSKPPVPPARGRSQSQVCLPPKNNHPVQVAPATNHPRNLSRCVSEASTNTNGSKHRRGGTVHRFSLQSLDSIVGEAMGQKQRSQSLPSEVPHAMASPGSVLTEEDAPEGYVSPLEEEEWVFRSDEKKSPARDESPAKETKVGQATPPSPLTRLKKEPPTIPNNNSWMWQWIQQKDGLPSVQEDEKLDVPDLSACKPKTFVCDELSVVSQRPDEPEAYFPQCQAMEDQWKEQCCSDDTCHISLSGWVAFRGKGRKLDPMATLEKQDVVYLVADAAKHLLWIASMAEDGQFRFASMSLTGCRVHVQEISRRRGRAAVVQEGVSGDLVCTILPVCVPEKYVGKGSLQHSQLFPEGSYLPDDQQYTTMHIMFSLDALIKF